MYVNIIKIIIGYTLVLLIFLGIPNYWDFFCSNHFLEFSFFSICSVTTIIEGILMFSVLVFYTKYSLKIIFLILFILEIILSIILCINLDIWYTTAYLGEMLGITIGYISFYIISKYKIKIIYTHIKNISTSIYILDVLLIINGIYTGIISGLLSGILFIILSILLFIFTLIFKLNSKEIDKIRR
jgi:hypothetical protein